MKNYDLRIHESPDPDGCRRLELRGCLDSHTVVGFEKSITELLNEHSSERLVIDISDLHYISSAGISALMSLTHRLRKQRGDLILLKPSDKILRVFRTLGFSSIFTIVSDAAEIGRPHAGG